jgi:GTP-binding protein LepA
MKRTQIEKIRNFAIIAHVDHGKSTLADRILELCSALDERDRKEQFLDQMELERERGITIKASSVRLNYKSDNGNEYIFNLIDTPGHVDFSYEVSRSLAACEGAVLVVDVTQGVEAQTVANAYLAMEHNLEIVPVINKMDIPLANPEIVKTQLLDVLGIHPEEVILASAKQGTGVKEILERIVEKIPPPSGDTELPLRALIFDSWYDSYQGVIILVRIFDGRIKKGGKIMLMSNRKIFEVQKTLVYNPYAIEVEELSAGEVGIIAAGIKEIQDAKIGDTVTDAFNPVAKPLPGFKNLKPLVFCGMFPINSDNYIHLKSALEKLRLNDSSFVYEPESSVALGHGFRCGFQGLLHMEITQERLEREFNLELITTAPTVVYRALTTAGEVIDIDNPARMPEQTKIESLEEPIITAIIHTPSEFVGNIIKLCEERRGIQKNLTYPTPSRALVSYEIPLSEIVIDFYDKMKSISRGYATMEYEFAGYREADLVRLDILINGEAVDALSCIVPKDKAYFKGRELVQKLREVIPRQLYEVVIQAAIGGKIIARETKKALRKDVLAKCYGGDITRKRKLLEKQKEGKKRMKQVGNVELPQEAFFSILKVGEK